MHIDDRQRSDGRMDERTGPAAEDGAQAAPTWEVFETRLAGVLEHMAADTCLIISAREVDDCSYYVQFAQGGRPGFRAEAVSNSFLSGAHRLSPAQEERLGRLGWQWPSGDGPGERNFSRQWPMRAPFRDVARLAVRTLRDVYGIRRPADLVYRRFDDGGNDFAEPGLGITPEGPRPRQTGRGGERPPECDGLDAIVERAVMTFLGVERLVRDDDGDIPVRVEDVAFFVRVIDGPAPAVRVFSPVVIGVDRDPELLLALNEMNARLLYARVLWVARDVILAAEVPAAHATEGLVGLVVAEVAQLASTLGPDLRTRFGPDEGRLARRSLVN